MRLTMCSLMGTFAGAGAPTGGIAPADATMCQLPLLRCNLRLSSFVLCQPTATNPKNGPAPEYLHFPPMFYSSSKRYLRHAKKQSAPGESQPSCGPNQTPQPRDRLALPRNTKTEHTQKADAHVTTVPTQHRRTRPTIHYAAFSNSGVLGGKSFDNTTIPFVPLCPFGTPFLPDTHSAASCIARRTASRLVPSSSVTVFALMTAHYRPRRSLWGSSHRVWGS